MRALVVVVVMVETVVLALVLDDAEAASAQTEGKELPAAETELLVFH